MSLEYFNKILRLVEKNDIAIYCYIEKNDPKNTVYMPWSMNVKKGDGRCVRNAKSAFKPRI